MLKESGSRRIFLKKAAGATAGLAGLSAFATSCAAAGQHYNSYKSSAFKPIGKSGSPRVVVARDKSIWNSDRMDPEAVKKLVFRAVKTLSGKDSDSAAWSAFFDGSEHVGIKLNCIAGRALSSTPEVTLAIIDGLLLAGVKPRSIIAWDRTVREIRNAGFTPGPDARGVLFTGTDDPEFGYDRNLTIAGEVGSLLSTIASRACDTLVNVPVLKDHDLCGISGALKNYFGAINNPNKLHDNNCDPYVADLNTMPAFKEKTRLIITDGTLAQYHGGPSYKKKYAWRFSGVIAGTDPVAVDTVALALIQEQRKKQGLPTLANEGRYPAYIDSAADPTRALGENQPEKIEVIEI